ncbi:YdeI/OmpD-associated family protein [Paenibacillus sp. BR2-3]|uniref:YdeI/OmpD-associated family protein n=1 Tax=Paenibacillus sp. BR2-3 TaxID=3048494 RepID=UPI00397743CB
MTSFTFEAEILKHDGMDAAYIIFPYDTKEKFGTYGQVKVKVIFDGTAEYRGSLAKMGLEKHCLGITKEIRSLIGKKPGDVIQVVLAEDTEPRTVDIPEDLLKELGDLNLLESFSALSYSKQKKMVDVILGSKRPETRVRNIQKLAKSLV